MYHSKRCLAPGVRTVQVPVWPEADGQDDIRYEGHVKQI